VYFEKKLGQIFIIEIQN